MLTTIKGYYKNGQIILQEEPPFPKNRGDNNFFGIAAVLKPSTF